MRSKAVPSRYSLALASRWLQIVLICSGVCWWDRACPQATELYQPAFQGTSRGSYQLSLLNSVPVDVAPVSVFDLAAGRERRLSDSYQGTAIAAGGGLTVNFPMHVPELPAFIRREIPSLWRITVPAGRAVGQRLPLRFEWEALDTSGTQQGGAGLEPHIKPWIHSQRQDDQGQVVIEGGIFIDIPTRSLSGDKPYRGRVIILIEEY